MNYGVVPSATTPCANQIASFISYYSGLARGLLPTIVLGWLLLLPGAVPALAAAGPWQEAPAVKARLIAAVEATGNAETVPLGLHLRLKPGWKSYWRSPGDAGFPPSLEWAGSVNVAGASVAWPAPIRFTQSGLETFGYESEVVLPLTLRLAQPGASLTARAGVEVLVCHDICVPQHFDLTLALPAGPAQPAPEAELLARFIAQVPGDGTAHGLSITAVRVGEKGGVEVEADSRTPFSSPDVILEVEPPLALGAPEILFADQDRRILARLPVREGAGETSMPPLVGRRVVVTLTDGDRAAEAVLTIASPGPSGMAGTAKARSSASAPQESGLLPVLVAALLGGLLLNLMPCVLPVLSLKLLSVLSHGGAAPRVIRRGFLATAAGILISFLALAAVTASLKAGGGAVGWGLQFQQPLFLLALILAVTLFACNLWGLFEIALPQTLADVGAGLGAGGHRGGPESLGGAFATGAFATLLATPCSAPFLGTAVGFALSRGPAEIVAVFLALGLGLSSPYLLVAAWPGLAAALPRPGHWMITLRRILALVLVGTGAWLLVIVSVLTPPVTPWLLAGLMAGLAVLVAGRDRLPGRPGVPVLAAAVLAVSLALPGILSGGAGPEVRESAAAPEAGGIPWQPFSLETIAVQLAAGRVVFVDVTADWCLTCKVNERLVLARGETAARLSAPDVVPLRANWTRPDAAIARYLASFGRYGIPFYVVYGPKAPQGLPLPELLTGETVLEAIAKAR